MNETILIVDDETHILKTCRRILSKESYACEVFSCPQRALKAAMMINPAVVVSDQRMPGMSGTVFLEKIRKNLPAATRVIMTGYADIDAVIQAINLGHVFRFIKKPWDDEEFTSQINNAVEFARMNRRLMQIMDTDETGKHALQERLQGVLEMAGAVCHEFAQPLQVISGYCDLLTDTPAGERDFICMEDQLAAIQGAAERLGSLLIKVMAIRRYRTRAYLEGQRIVDIHAASEPDRGDPVPLELQNRGNSRQD